MKLRNCLAVLLATVFVASGLRAEAAKRFADQEETDGATGKPTQSAPAYTDNGYSSCCDSCCSSCCSTGLHWYADAEATLFRYHRADGVRIGNSAPADDVEFGFELAPRFTVGVTSSDGLGLRVRYWSYDETAASFGRTGTLHVEASNLDIETYETYDITCSTCVELSGGVRFNDFQETMLDNGVRREHEFSTIGGLVGLKVKRNMSFGGNVYATGRGSLLMSDMRRVNNGSGTQDLLDVTNGIVELGTGYEWGTCVADWVVTFRTGVEWQNWFNYSGSFTGNDERFWGAPADVGFGGFVLGVTLAR